MRALTMDPWRITARTHKVAGQAFVYVTADLDTRRTASWEIPGGEVGIDQSEFSVATSTSKPPWCRRRPGHHVVVFPTRSNLSAEHREFSG